jgi:hypothetical protein
MPRIFDLSALELTNVLLDAVFGDIVPADCTHNCRIYPEEKCAHNRPSVPAVYYGQAGLTLVIETREIPATIRIPE